MIFLHFSHISKATFQLQYFVFPLLSTTNLWSYIISSATLEKQDLFHACHIHFTPCILHHFTDSPSNYFSNQQMSFHYSDSYRAEMEVRTLLSKILKQNWILFLCLTPSKNLQGRLWTSFKPRSQGSVTSKAYTLYIPRELLCNYFLTYVFITSLSGFLAGFLHIICFQRVGFGMLMNRAPGSTGHPRTCGQTTSMKTALSPAFLYNWYHV